ARKCDGLVYPPIFTAFAGATRLYPGTVPFSYEFHAQVLKATVRSLHRQGLGRIFLLGYTNPEDAAGLIAARDLFDTEGELPVASLVATRGLTSAPVKKLLSEYQGSAGEALIDYAAMRLLGRERPVAEPELARAGLRGGEDQPKEIREAVRILRARHARLPLRQRARARLARHRRPDLPRATRHRAGPDDPRRARRLPAAGGR